MKELAKSSGIYWLGEIPAHWNVRKIKHIASDDGVSFTDGDWVESPFITDSGIRLLQTGNVGTGVYREQGFRYISEASFKELRCTEVFPGDVLVCRLADPVGRSCLAPDLGVRMITSVDVCILRPKPTVDPRFAVYYMSCAEYLGFLNSSQRGGTRDRVSRTMLGNVAFLEPPLKEQIAIVSYLDAETKRIDGLIGEKVSLLGMLEEYRSSAIFELLEGSASHVSEGCDPSLGWLRAVPSHWTVCGLGKRYEVQLGKMLDAKRITGEFLRPYLRNQDVQWRHINVDNLPLMDFDAADRQKFSLQKGDVLVCEGGEVGRAAVWSSDFECFYQKAIHRLRPLTSEDDPEFVVLLLETAVKCGVFNIAEKSTIAHLPADQLRQHRFPFPPRVEQRQIVDQSRMVSDRVRELQKHVTIEIEMLKELRASTITDAVLGRIDVSSHMKS